MREIEKSDHEKIILLTELSKFSPEKLSDIVLNGKNPINRINAIQVLRNFHNYLERFKDVFLKFLDNEDNFPAFIDFKSIISSKKDLKCLLKEVVFGRVHKFNGLWDSEFFIVDFDKKLNNPYIEDRLEELTLPVFCKDLIWKYKKEVVFQVKAIEKLCKMPQTCEYFDYFWSYQDIYQWLAEIANDEQFDNIVRALAYIKLKYVMPDEFNNAITHCKNRELVLYLMEYDDTKMKHLVPVE